MQPLNILFLSNNEHCYNLLQWIDSKDKINYKLFEDRLTVELLQKFNPHLVISYGYRYIIGKDVINSMRNRIINLHISYLPWNRGADPNIWSFIDDTPKGVTIHFIDEGIDTGHILFQKEITFDENKETLSSSYNRLQYEMQKLFKDNWNDIIGLKFLPIEQAEPGSIHYKKDFEKISFLIEEHGWNTRVTQLVENYQRYMLNNENI